MVDQQMSKRATRKIDIIVNVPRAAAEVTAAVYTQLALQRESVGEDDFASIFAGVYSTMLSIMNGIPVQGLVPLPIFQLLAALRPRVVDLGALTQFSVRCVPSTVANPTLPPVSGSGDDHSNFTQRASTLDGVLVDLQNINALTVGPFPNMGYPSKISVGASLGPLNLYYPESSRYNCARIRTQNMHVTEKWMSYFTWADSFGSYPHYTEEAVVFPQTQKGSEITPGSIILSTALRIADVIGTQSFNFVAFDLACTKAYLDANVAARLVANETKTAQDYHYDLRASIALLAGVGLRAGQPAFAPAFFELSNYQLPQDIVEASLALPTFREGNARIPFVYTQTLNNSGFYRFAFADGTPDAVRLASVSTTTAPRDIGISNAEISYNASAFVNNTYNAQSKFTALTWTGKEPNWKGAPTVTATASPVVDWNALLKNTISNGPLSRPNGDKVMTTFNMTDFTAGHYGDADPVSGRTVVGYLNLNCFAAGVQGPNLPMVASLPLPREEIVANNGYQHDFQQAPLVQCQQKLISPASYATAHTVTEDSAKYTEIQQFFENMQVNGWGGAGLFGDIVRHNGQVAFRARKVRALGFSITGKKHVVSVVLTTPVRKNNRRGKQQQNTSRRVRANNPKPRSMRGMSSKPQGRRGLKVTLG